MLLIVGFPLGFFASGCFSGFGSYLAELYPTRARATGEGFCYNVGRGLERSSRASSASSRPPLDSGGAIAFGVFGYVLAMLAATAPPETHGREIRAVERASSRRCAALGPMTSSSRASPARRCGRRTSPA